MNASFIVKAAAIIFVSVACFSFTVHAQAKPTTTDSASATNPVVVERDGSSFEKAIIILKTTEGEGTKAEYAWLRDKYPGYKPHKQSLNYHDKKPFDILTITTADGKELIVCFDISNFFGKF